VVRGEKVGLQARAYRLVGTDSVEIKNMRFNWISSNATIATVAGDDFGGAELTGVNSGLVDVSATAVAFEASSVGSFQMRVANFLEVDSVTPDSLQWGAKATVHGVGVRNIFASLPGSDLLPDTFTFQGDPQGLGSMSFWVPPPARSGQMFFVGLGVFLNAADSTRVDSMDLFEMVAPNTVNDTVPALISLDGAPPFPPIPQILFLNPALAFEGLPRAGSATVLDDRRYDWYRFARADTLQPFTLILKPQSLIDSTGLFIVVGDSLVWNTAGFHVPGNLPPGSATETWFITSEHFWVCPRGGFSPEMKRADSLILSLKRRPGYGPGRGMHLLAFYSQPQPYGMIVVNGFLPTDQRIGEDRFEENDICTFADHNQSQPATRIVVTPLGVPFADSTLTIDTPHEVDFYRFTVNAVAAESVMVKVRSRPFGTGPIVLDRSDVDLYVLRQTDFAEMGFVSDQGSRDSLRLFLPPGDYYLAVADFVGEVTRYSLCIQVRGPCVPPVAAVEAALVLPGARARARGRDDGRTKTGWARARDWAVPASALRGPGSPWRRR
jgi:hypothetical protein